MSQQHINFASGAPATGDTLQAAFTKIEANFGELYGQDIASVKTFGAKGDGATDDTVAIQACLNFCFGTSTAPHGSTSPQSNSICYFPPGNYKISSPLTVRSVRGGRIMGAGRFTTQISQSTSGSSVFVTNGFEYSIVDGIRFIANGSGSVGFDLDWDNTGTAALQSNTFRDCEWENGDFGLRIGNSGFMGSETTIINCFFATQQVAAAKICNFNALSNCFYGGNIASCANIGIWVHAGSAPSIHGVGFQNGANVFDIQVDNSAEDLCNIIGCRSESTNFVFLGNSVHATVIGCEHISNSSNSNGTFVSITSTGGSPTLVERCTAVKSDIALGSAPRLAVRGSSFGLTNWIHGGTPSSVSAGCVVEMEDIQYSGTPNGSGLSTTNRIYKQRIDVNGISNYVLTKTAGLFSALPVSPVEGQTAIITDSSTATWGATISGSGGNRVLGYYDGSNWTVFAK